MSAIDASNVVPTTLLLSEDAVVMSRLRALCCWSSYTGRGLS